MSHRPSSIFAMALLGLGMVAAGSVVAASKLAVTSLPPFTAACLRYGLAAVILVPWAWTRHGLPRLSRHDGLILVAQATLGSLGFSLLLLLGLRLGEAAPASVAAGSLPLLVLALGSIQSRRMPRPRLLFACVLAVLGLAAAGRHGSLSSLIFAAIACEAAFVTLDRAMHHPPPPLTLSALLCLGGTLLTLPGALTESWPAAVPAPAWAALLWHSVIGTVLGFWSWYAGTARLGAAAAAPFTALFPLTGLVASPLVLGVPPDTETVLGGVLVIGAILLAAAPHGRPMAEKTERV
ncbi:MAG: DMT family transporter [Magnetospirillum gryphiswaldense]|nr:DMT family transporter [Magnetospirillum gryphiswaldense]